MIFLLLLGRPSCDGREGWEARLKRWRCYSTRIYDKTFPKQETLHSSQLQATMVCADETLSHLLRWRW